MTAVRTFRVPLAETRRGGVPVLVLSLAVLLLRALSPGPAQAQALDVCQEERLTVEGDLDALWIKALVDACGALAGLKGIDPSAQLRVHEEGTDLIVHVTTAGGLSALRRVRSPDGLQRTIEALVLLPNAPPAPALAVVADASETELARADAAPRAPAESPATGAVRTAPDVGLELGVAVVGRMSRAPAYLSLGLQGYAGLRVAAWLLGLAARWDGYQTLAERRPDHFEMSTAGGGFLLQRRVLTAKRVGLDVAGTTWILAQSQSIGPEGPHERAGSASDVRVGLLARLVDITRVVRWTLAIDTELSPARLMRTLRVAESFPKLPAWSLALALGVAWEAV